MSVSGSSDALPSELRGKFASIRRWQMISKFATVLTVIAVVIMFYLFATSTKEKVEANTSDQQRNQKALEAALAELTPSVVSSLQTVATEAGPVYQQLASERFQRVRENLGTKAAVRFQQLPEDGGKVMGERLVRAFESVLKKVEPDLQAAFPSLTDAQRRDLLIAHFHDVIETRNKAIAVKIDAVKANEQSRVKAVLDKFALPPDEAAGGNEQLQKELTQTLLLLAQAELEEMTSKQAATSPAPKK